MLTACPISRIGKANRLRDESHASILIACTKCDWKAAFDRDELIAAHGADYPLPNLLTFVAAPGCSRLGSQWDRCGAYYVEPIKGRRSGRTVITMRLTETT